MLQVHGRRIGSPLSCAAGSRAGTAGVRAVPSAVGSLGGVSEQEGHGVGRVHHGDRVTALHRPRAPHGLLRRLRRW